MKRIRVEQNSRFLKFPSNEPIPQCKCIYWNWINFALFLILTGQRKTLKISFSFDFLFGCSAIGVSNRHSTCVNWYAMPLEIPNMLSPCVQTLNSMGQLLIERNYCSHRWGRDSCGCVKVLFGDKKKREWNGKF